MLYLNRFNIEFEKWLIVVFRIAFKPSLVSNFTFPLPLCYIMLIAYPTTIICANLVLILIIKFYVLRFYVGFRMI